jgi:hypothetical protein
MEYSRKIDCSQAERSGPVGIAAEGNVLEVSEGLVGFRRTRDNGWISVKIPKPCVENDETR